MEKVFTIGYGNRSKEVFLDLLRTNEIRTVVDVRLRPDCARLGTWVKARTPDKGVEKWLMDSGFGYKSIIELGNMFLGLDDWRERYQQLLVSSGELLIKRMEGLPEPICLMCAEMDVNTCHRQLIAAYLTEKWGGIEIIHL